MTALTSALRGNPLGEPHKRKSQRAERQYRADRDRNVARIFAHDFSVKTRLATAIPSKNAFSSFSVKHSVACIPGNP